MTKMESFSVKQEENTKGIITECVCACVCVWWKDNGVSSFVHPYSLLIWRLQCLCVCVGGRNCVTYRKLCPHSFRWLPSPAKLLQTYQMLVKSTLNSCFILTLVVCTTEMLRTTQKKKWDGKFVILCEMNECLGQEGWIPHVNEKQQKNPKEVTSHWLLKKPAIGKICCLSSLKA